MWTPRYATQSDSNVPKRAGEIRSATIFDIKILIWNGDESAPWGICITERTFAFWNWLRVIQALIAGFGDPGIAGASVHDEGIRLPFNLQIDVPYYALRWLVQYDWDL